MVDTSIKVDELVRDRLAQLAREQGMTIRDLVADLAGARLTAAELDARYAAAHAYIAEHLCPDLTVADTAAGRWVWEELRAGRLPASLSPPEPVPARLRTDPADPAAAEHGSRRAG